MARQSGKIKAPSISPLCKVTTILLTRFQAMIHKVFENLSKLIGVVFSTLLICLGQRQKCSGPSTINCIGDVFTNVLRIPSGYRKVGRVAATNRGRSRCQLWPVLQMTKVVLHRIGDYCNRRPSNKLNVMKATEKKIYWAIQVAMPV